MHHWLPVEASPGAGAAADDEDAGATEAAEAGDAFAGDGAAGDGSAGDSV